jgi:phospholipid transport system substrate-binding protein
MCLNLPSKERGRGSMALQAFSIALVLGFFVSRVEAGSTPLDTVKTGTEKVLHILGEHAGNKQKRRAEIRMVVDEYFDFGEIAKRALGPHWQKQPPEKQREYVQAFSDFLFGVYINRIEKYTDEKITYETKEERGDHALVDAIVVGSQTGRIAIQYRLHHKDGSWRAYDVVIEGVGLVDNYRGQFSSILANNSFSDLLNRLKDSNRRNK